MRHSIATLPGAAARAPNKQARDVHQPHAATKVQTPPRKASNPFLEAVLSGDQQPATRHAAMNGRTTGTRPARFRFPVRLVTANGTTLGADTLTRRRWRPLRAAGRATITNRLTF